MSVIQEVCLKLLGEMYYNISSRFVEVEVVRKQTTNEKLPMTAQEFASQLAWEKNQREASERI